LRGHFQVKLQSFCKTKNRVMLDLSTFRSTAEERKGEDDPKAE